MPIVFQQPDANAASPGAVQNYLEAARMLQQAQRTSFGGGGGGGYTGGGGGGYGFGIGGGGGGRGEPDYQSMYDARARAQLEVQQGSLNIAEQNRLNRLRAAQANVDQLVSDGRLTPEEGNDYQIRLQTGIDPLQRRAARSAVQRVEIQNQLAQHQNAMRTSMLTGDAASVTGQANRFFIRSPGGVEGWLNPLTGEFRELHGSAQATQQIAQQRAAQQAEQRQNQQDAADDASFRSNLTRIEAGVRGRRSGTDPSAPLTSDERQEITNRMRQAGFFSSDLSEHQDIRRDKPLAGPNARPGAQPNERQQGVLNAFNQLRAQTIAANGGTDERYQMTRPGQAPQPWLATQLRNIQTMEDAFRYYGSQLRMPDDVLQRMRELASQVNRWNETPVYQAPPPGQPQGQPAAAQALPFPQGGGQPSGVESFGGM